MPIDVQGGLRVHVDAVDGDVGHCAMTWDELDWGALDRLRDGFLHGGAAQGPYWHSAGDLASYDFTYGERIGWKWDAVLGELKLRGWSPPAGPVLDWGCGSGVAGRRVLGAFRLGDDTALRVRDYSALACEFALAAARAAFPNLVAERYRDDEPVGLLVVSHVLNELDAAGRAELSGLMERADAVIWVEPGTHSVSRDLLPWRERLLATHRVIAPCTHQAACGLLVPGRERDWCHHFARPPAGIQADPRWVKFSQRAGIDLRSLPYSFLVLERKGVRASPASLPAEAGRILGRPEFFKPYARVFNCDASGVNELTIPRRTAPALYKELEKTRGPLLYVWQREGTAVRSARPAYGSDAAAE